MAIGAKHTKIFRLIVLCVTVNMVYMQDWLVVYWVLFVPPTLLALIATRFYQVISDGSF